MPQNRRSLNSRGVTLVDALLAAVITVIGIIGLMQMFAYGRIQVDRLGVRRQALAALEGEMEQYRAKWSSMQKNNALGPLPERGKQTVLLESGKGTIKVPASILPDVASASKNGYNGTNVTLVIQYDYRNYKDSLGLSTCFYY